MNRSHTTSRVRNLLLALGIVALMMPMFATATSAQSSGVAVILGEWAGDVRTAADEAAIPWQVLAAVMIVESGGNPTVSSLSGAVGLMQLRPEQWFTYNAEGQFGADIWDPASNLRVGAAILADQFRQHGSWDTAVAGYAGVLDDNGRVGLKQDDSGKTGTQYVEDVRAQAANLGYYIAGSALAGAANMQLAVMIAKSTMGTPYVWGGQSYEQGGFDCSGLIVWAYTQAGFSLPRVAEDQFAATQRLQPQEVQPGDLIFFYNTFNFTAMAEIYGERLLGPNQQIVTHVGIYVGNGMMLHAPKEGDVVRMVPLSDPFWRTHLAGYGRVS